MSNLTLSKRQQPGPGFRQLGDKFGATDRENPYGADVRVQHIVLSSWVDDGLEFVIAVLSGDVGAVIEIVESSPDQENLLPVLRARLESAHRTFIEEAHGNPMGQTMRRHRQLDDLAKLDAVEDALRAWRSKRHALSVLAIADIKTLHP